MDEAFRNILRNHQERLKQLKGTYVQPEESEELDAARAAFGLSGELTKDLIESRFKELVKKHHPDKNGDREIFQALVIHRETLLGL
jgi:DnaJ-domain-containing protein 1